MEVLSEACIEPQFVCDGDRGHSGRAVRQLSGGGPDSSAEVSNQESISFFSDSPEELAKRQRDEPAFRWLVDFLKLGIAHQDSELILPGPEEKCFYLERERLEWIRRELSGELVLLILISSWFRVVYGRK